MKNDRVCDVFRGLIRWGQRTLQRHPLCESCIDGHGSIPISSTTPSLIKPAGGNRILVPATLAWLLALDVVRRFDDMLTRIRAGIMSKVDTDNNGFFISDNAR